MAKITLIVLLLAGTWSALPTVTPAQGETTSAIVGQVNDPTNAGVPGATVTITNQETGLKRTAKTDDSGQFNFPQLKPGTYSVQVEADGFASQQNDNVIAGLGQKQTVNFTLKLAQSEESIEITGVAPIINPGNANTSTNLNAPALENLPNPGGDLTYPFSLPRARSSTRQAAATISSAARMDTATSSSMDCPLYRTATSSMAWKPTIR